MYLYLPGYGIAWAVIVLRDQLGAGQVVDN